MELANSVSALCDLVRSMNTADGRLYKPAFLAAALDAVERGEVTDNRILFRPLVGPFERKIREMGQTGGTTQAAYGFFYLSREPFWDLVYKTEGGAKAVRRTGVQLDEHVRHAQFAQPYWALLQDRGARAHVRAALHEAWGLGAPADRAESGSGTLSLFSASGPYYWWVNHNQTHREEIEGGYVWSPKANKNGARNKTYLNLTRVASGDVVFSYAGGRIRAVGLAAGPHREADRPAAFGETGEQWDTDGWLVPVEWVPADPPLRPKDHMDRIGPLLPDSHAPIRPNGDGNQFCYLAAIGEPLGRELLALLRAGGGAAPDDLCALKNEAEERRELERIEASDLPTTEKEQLVHARRGQGRFRQAVCEVESSCRLTGVTDRRFLVASHIKPWRTCTDWERLDGHNGLLLAPHVDRLFDGGHLSFSDCGDILCRDEAVRDVMAAWGLDPDRNVGPFSEEQRVYLAYHRSVLFVIRE